MSLSKVISRWKSQPEPEPFVSEQPPHDPERRNQLLLRRLYDLLPDHAQVRLRTDGSSQVSQLAAA
jgi:hypothetical protein